jgi:hypothetical protein
MSADWQSSCRSYPTAPLATAPPVPGGNDSFDSKYSPAKRIGTQTAVSMGDPDPKHIGTSFVERQNLTMRLSMRRFTRLPNGHSKKLANHIAAIALYCMHYDFCRLHQTLRVTPAMEAGLAGQLRSIEELAGPLDWFQLHQYRDPAAIDWSPRTH